MWILKLCLLPFAVIVEFLALLIAILLIAISVKHSEKVINWAQTRLPNRNWYLGS